MPLIRPSRDEDLDAITRIYGHHVLHGTGTFETTPPSLADMTARRADVLAKGLPWLVAEEGGQVLGFAYGNWFKPRPAYRFSVEDSIYMDPAAHRKGLGRALLAELLALGFEPVGVVQSCGWKFDRWLDIVLMQKTLGAGDSTPPDGPA
jgi:L-amino acid N-acyltransferase YncA